MLEKIKTIVSNGGGEINKNHMDFLISEADKAKESIVQMERILSLSKDLNDTSGDNVHMLKSALDTINFTANNFLQGE